MPRASSTWAAVIPEEPAPMMQAFSPGASFVIAVNLANPRRKLAGWPVPVLSPQQVQGDAERHSRHRAQVMDDVQAGAGQAEPGASGAPEPPRRRGG